jgi:hypothetical protein
MTGSAKQSISPRKEGMDCFASLAMTKSYGLIAIFVIGPDQNIENNPMHSS